MTKKKNHLTCWLKSRPFGGRGWSTDLCYASDFIFLKISCSFSSESLYPLFSSTGFVLVPILWIIPLTNHFFPSAALSFSCFSPESFSVLSHPLRWMFNCFFPNAFLFIPKLNFGFQIMPFECQECFPLLLKLNMTAFYIYRDSSSAHSLKSCAFHLFQVGSISQTGVKTPFFRWIRIHFSDY